MSRKAFPRQVNTKSKCRLLKGDAFVVKKRKNEGVCIVYDSGINLVLFNM